MSDDWTIRRKKEIELEWQRKFTNLSNIAADIHINFDPKYLKGWNEPKECDCGAKHTSFPKHHYHWCSVKVNK